MASKALNAANLEALGATRLARLLIEISEGNAPAKRRLRPELAGADSPTAVANQIRKRIATIARSRSFVDWHNRKSLVDDLEAQRRAIIDQVATRLPTEGLDLMWRFVDLAESIFARCDDSSGAVIKVFHSAVADLGVIATSAKPPPDAAKATVRFSPVKEVVIPRSASRYASRDSHSGRDGPPRTNMVDPPHPRIATLNKPASTRPLTLAFPLKCVAIGFEVISYFTGIIRCP
jgi:hypothetical protein